MIKLKERIFQFLSPLLINLRLLILQVFQQEHQDHQKKGVTIEGPSSLWETRTNFSPKNVQLPQTYEK